MKKIIDKALSSLLRFIIGIYQIFLSPILGNNCRFEPNCSAYAVEAITEHGPVKGLWLSIKRIARCNPWNYGGLDPIPLQNDLIKYTDKTIKVSSGDVLKNDR